MLRTLSLQYASNLTIWRAKYLQSLHNTIEDDVEEANRILLR